MRTENEIKKRIAELQKSEDHVDWNDFADWCLSTEIIHEGADKKRCDYKPTAVSPNWINREKIFADRWKETNAPPHGINYGVGTLTWLLCARYSEKGQGVGIDSSLVGIERSLTQEEATAAASAIQWLGSNCGWNWMEECIRACGFDIVMRRGPR